MKREKIQTIEFARGLAALFVVWYHLTFIFRQGEDASILGMSGALGFLGVEVFFVLSGFIIPFSINNSTGNYGIRSLKGFMLRRILRIEPPYIASILFSLLVGYAATLSSSYGGIPFVFDPAQIALHLGYLIPFTEKSWINVVYWTLAYEFAYYLGVGLLFPYIGRNGTKIAFCCIAAILLLSIFFSYIPGYWALFIIGFSTYRLYAHDRREVVAIMAIILSVACLFYLNMIPHAITAIATSALIFWNKNLPEVGYRFRRILGFLGMISYSLYLTHAPF